MVRLDQIALKATQAQIDAFNRLQHSGRFHPLTCGNRKNIRETHADGEGVLIATEDGLVCPYCDYRQVLPLPHPPGPIDE